MPLLHPDRLFPPEPRTRGLARALYEAVRDAPIVSPHGHCDPRWFAEDTPFADPARLFVTPDHYVLRMLYSQGERPERLGVARRDGGPVETDPRAIWRRFAEGYHLFAGTPSRLWLDHAFSTLFGIEERLGPGNADALYDRIAAALREPGFRPRALYERFNIHALTTTDNALAPLTHHAAIRASGWHGRILTAYRPDAVTDPDAPGFAEGVRALGAMTGEDTEVWSGYLAAHRRRRADFIAMGCTSTDHGHPTPRTLDLPPAEAAALFARCLSGAAEAAEREAFRAQMLTEFARMSLDDGLVMQLHCGSRRNHNARMLADVGPDAGFDIPGAVDYVEMLRPLLNAHGLDPRLTLVVFTLDETTYARELAPLAGAYPALRLGAPWWFHDSVEGMTRFRQQATETAGFFNTVGFTDDTRAFCSIPARHDVARRVDCAFLAGLVADHRLDEAEAFEIAPMLAWTLARDAYKLGEV